MISSSFSRELIRNGTLTAKEKAVVPFAVNEQISDVRVSEGEQIEEGSLLAIFDAFTFKKRQRDAQNNYDKSLIDFEDLLLSYGHQLLILPKYPVMLRSLWFY